MLYKPAQWLTKTATSAVNGIDGFLDKLINNGALGKVGSDIVSSLKSNPLADGIRGLVSEADQLVNRDLPSYGALINDSLLDPAQNFLSKMAESDSG